MSELARDATSDPLEGRRTTEQLRADAQTRVQLTAELPQRLAQVRAWAANAERTVAASTDVHGALQELRIAESALAVGPEALGQEIVRVAERARRAALYQGVNQLGDALGDSAALDLMRSSGLGDLIGEDAPVLPYVPGVDPNAHRWNVIE
jgi:hypothetical protein